MTLVAALPLPALVPTLAEWGLLVGTVWLLVIFTFELTPLTVVRLAWRAAFGLLTAAAVVVVLEIPAANKAGAKDAIPTARRARLVNALHGPGFPSQIQELLEAKGYEVEYVYNQDLLRSAIIARDCHLPEVALMQLLLPGTPTQRYEKLDVAVEVDVGLIDGVQGRTLLLLGPDHSRKVRQLRSYLRAPGLSVLVRDAPMAPATSISVNPVRRDAGNVDLAHFARLFTFLGDLNGVARARVPEDLRFVYDVAVWVGRNADPVNAIKAKGVEKLLSMRPCLTVDAKGRNGDGGLKP